MKLTFNLSEDEIKEAIINFVKTHYGLAQDKNFKVSLSYYNADSRDPRERSYHSAVVSE